MSRPHSPALDAILGQPLPVLDHGFVRVVDYMGDDSAVVQAARVSYGGGTKSVRDDEGLIRYLLRHQHTTPFEMAELKLHVKLPIFVARQWIRHRTASVNEYSARYSVVEDEFYLPSGEAISQQSEANKQGRGEVLQGDAAHKVESTMSTVAKQAYDAYRGLLGTDTGKQDTGVARELARAVLPVSFYTQWYWKTDLHNLLRFLELRMDPHAQWEIRQYAFRIAGIVEQWVPATYKAFRDYRLDRLELSAAARQVVMAWLNGKDVSLKDSDLSRREWDELKAAFDRPR
jgi:thymidylate synthase (FAD)